MRIRNDIFVTYRNKRAGRLALFNELASHLSGPVGRNPLAAFDTWIDSAITYRITCLQVG